MDEFSTITTEQWADYERIADELQEITTSDVVQLKRIWETNYEIIIKLDNEGAKPLYKRLIALKDFMKEKCVAGTMEVYHRAQVGMRGRLIYKAVWKEQLEILTTQFLVSGGKPQVGKIDELRARLYVYKNEMEVFEKMTKRLELDIFNGGYQVVQHEVGNPDVVIGVFETLEAAEQEMRQILGAAMRATPEKFTFEDFA